MCTITNFELLKSFIIFMFILGSIVGLKGNAGQSAYSASKAGLVGFSRSFAKEVARKNIQVNMVAPGEFWVQLPILCHIRFIFFEHESLKTWAHSYIKDGVGISPKFLLHNCISFIFSS